MIEFTRDLLVDLGGWAVLKEAKALVEAKRVKSLHWEGKLLSGQVEMSGTKYFPRLNLRSVTFAENRCNCFSGRRGIVCAHSIALCVLEMEGGIKDELVETPDALEDVSVEQVLVQSLVLSEERGIPARFRILLPPNLRLSAPKDRIMVKIEFELANGQLVMPEKIDRGHAYHLDRSHQSLGGLIEGLCSGKLHGLLQLKRRQLLQLLNAISGEPAVYWINALAQPITWTENVLEGVHAFLQIPEKVEEKITAKIPSLARPDTKKITANRSSNIQLEVDGSSHYLAIRLPGREDSCYFPILELLQGYGFKLETSNGKWWLRDKHKTLNFLSDHYEELKTRFRARFTSNFEQRLSGLSEIQVHAEAVKLGDDFELQVSLGGDLSNNRLREQLSKGRRYIEENGKVLLLNQKKLDDLNRISAKLSDDPHRAWNTSIRVTTKPWELNDLEGILGGISVDFTPPKEWQARSEALKNLSRLKEAPVPASLNNTLRLYQKIGVAWLYHLYRNELGGILADEMGLGKTIQAISLIEVIRKSEKGISLVICPAGLVGNWAREFSKFAPNLRIYCHHGSGRIKSSDHWSGQFDVIITSYSTLSRDEALFCGMSFDVAIGDEAQHIKNRRTQHAKSLKRLRTKGRFLLTGTPIENSMEDLLSLFEFLLPGYLKKPQQSLNADDRAWFHQRIRERSAPYLLRRTKKNVAPELPEKIEQVLYCDMDSVQKKFYESIRRRCAENIGKLEDQGASEGQLKMAAFTELLRLRQICADPRLLDAQMESIHSAKFQAFQEILDESIDGGHRILVFSQFVSLLKLLRTELEQNNTSYCYIDGSTRDRLAEADRFNESPDIPVFLISLKAGGTGLNLTGADTVVHYDPWWNPAAEAQATDRAHRIGQKKVVTSIKLIISGSVEEKVLRLQHQKLRSLSELFEASDASLGKLQLDDLKSLILPE